MLKIKGNANDLGAMLISALRYTLGRRTYIVQWTCEFIGNNIELLTKKDKHIMIRDIKECEDYGADFDEHEWKILLEKLEKNINEN